MASIRITVTGDAEQVDAIKEQFFKQYIDGAGAKVVFEVPEGATAEADAIVEAAKAAGLEAEKADYEDPLEDAGGVDFW